MKIGIYNPYLDTSGGGEKYILSIAESLVGENKVEIFLDDHLFSIGVEEIKTKLSHFHQADFAKVSFVKAPFGENSNFLKKYFFLKDYDVLIYLTDGSFFFSPAKKNFVHFQMPIENPRSNFFWEKIKINSWKGAIFNSYFTKNYIEKEWPIKGVVIYPPVDINVFKPRRKKQQILTVGFFSLSKPKKHEVLIEAFKRLSRRILKEGWQLAIAGGVDESSRDYLKSLRILARGYNIKFYPNVGFKELLNLYGESLIYWHAAGFGENDPKKFEHFGISTVEAMSSGCIPIVINLGGQPEIIQDNISGILWTSVDDLIQKTMDLVGDKNKIKKIAKKARERSLDFSKETFSRNINALIKEK